MQRSKLDVHNTDPNSCHKLQKRSSTKSDKPNSSTDVSGPNSLQEPVLETKPAYAVAVKKPDTEVPTLEFLSHNFPGITFHPKTKS